MADSQEQEQAQPLLLTASDSNSKPTQLQRPPRVASLDVFRGLSVFLMMVVDYGGSIFPMIAHAPWNGIHLADLVMPFFLFIAGVSLALVYKTRPPRRLAAASQALLRALKLFAVGILLQGGYFHGVNSFTFGVDIQTIRWLGILQRISIGYIVAALCEIWLPPPRCKEHKFDLRSYFSHWFVAVTLLALYSGLLYGLYVPDWQFLESSSTSSFPQIDGDIIYTVNCSVRGDLGPACNSAGMIDRYVLGINHLYRKPVYRNLKECNMSTKGQVSDTSPPWCHSPFDPEGILSSITAAVSCIIGLQYGHVLAHLQEHKGRLNQWLWLSASFSALGFFLALIGIPLNKSLYTISYMLITSAASGLTFIALYVLVDVNGHRRLTSVLEWMGKHSLSIFVLVSSNMIVIAIQGFYWTKPENNIKRKQDLIAETVFEEQRGKELSKIVYELVPAMKNNSAQKSSRARKRSNDRSRMSMCRTEEAERYFQDFISDVEDTRDISSLDGERNDTSSSIGGLIKPETYSSPPTNTYIPGIKDGVSLPWLQWETSNDVSHATSLNNKAQMIFTPKAASLTQVVTEL